jgi:uncharacterized membrane protein
LDRKLSKPVTNSNGSTDRQAESRINLVLLSILLGLLVGALAVSNQSLWIDEAHSAAKAIQPSLAKWWTAMVQDKGSDLQMPFYMLYLWAWAKLFGTSEAALRAANVPWFILGLVALLWAFPKEPALSASRMGRHRQFAVAAITLTNAFLWYYISEARPYVVLFAFSALTGACLLRLREDSGSAINSPAWFQLFLLGIVGVCATNLIAVPWAIAAGLAFIFWAGIGRALRTATRFPLSSAFAICALIALTCYYLWSLRVGARASNVGQTGLPNLAFAFYELLGVAGLGPGRLALREQGGKILFEYIGPVILGIIAVLVLLSAAFIALRKNTTRRDLIFFGIAAILPLAVLIAGAVIGHLRLLGRHFAPLLPFLMILFAIGLERMWFGQQRWLRIAAIVAVIVFLTSALEIRFAPRHQRDDYRSAANLARSAVTANEKVWWIADEVTGAYYKLPLDSPNLTLSANLTDNSLAGAPTPDLVCLSKSDIYDPRGKIDNYLREHDFKVTRVLPAFQVLERKSAARR